MIKRGLDGAKKKTILGKNMIFHVYEKIPDRERESVVRVAENYVIIINMVCQKYDFQHYENI